MADLYPFYQYGQVNVLLTFIATTAIESSKIVDIKQVEQAQLLISGLPALLGNEYIKDVYINVGNLLALFCNYETLSDDNKNQLKLYLLDLDLSRLGLVTAYELVALENKFVFDNAQVNYILFGKF